jgi:focal adhesion kinase 1
MQQQPEVLAQTKHFIEAKIRKQKEESEIDSKWLQQQEDNIKKRLSINSMSDCNEIEVIQAIQQQQQQQQPRSDLYSSVNAKQPMSPQMVNSGGLPQGIVSPLSPGAGTSSSAFKKPEAEGKVSLRIF